MDDESFLAYVLSNAPRFELETLEKIIRGLASNIAGRRWGKPASLEVGSHVEATMFDSTFRYYGTVTGLTPKGCVIEPPDSEYTRRVSYQKYAIRILDEYEWNRVCDSLSRWHKEFEEKYVQEQKERFEDREDAIRNRDKAARKPKLLPALNGPVEVFRGAYVHAFHPKSGCHDYGVVVDITSKRVILSNSESDWEPRIWLNKNEVYLLDDQQWAVVDTEQKRRRDEYETSKKAGTKRDIPDYSEVEIDLSMTR